NGAHAVRLSAGHLESFLGASRGRPSGAGGGSRAGAERRGGSSRQAAGADSPAAGAGRDDGLNRCAKSCSTTPRRQRAVLACASGSCAAVRAHTTFSRTFFSPSVVHLLGS